MMFKFQTEPAVLPPRPTTEPEKAPDIIPGPAREPDKIPTPTTPWPQRDPGRSPNPPPQICPFNPR